MFSPQSRLRHAVADTFAMVVYCSVVNMLIEIFLSGMSFEQSLVAPGGHSGEYHDRPAVRPVPRCSDAFSPAY